MRVVSDTSPLNYLALIGASDILPALFTTIAIPESVKRELCHIETPAIVRDFVRAAPPWLVVHSVPLGDDLALARLDEGEWDAIVLSQRLHADLLLMDERAGVRAARAAGLAASGTLGLLDRAGRRGLLDMADTVAKLRLTSFRCRPALLDALLRQHGIP